MTRCGFIVFCGGSANASNNPFYACFRKKTDAKASSAPHPLTYTFYCLIIFSKQSRQGLRCCFLRRLRLGLSCRKPENNWNCRLRKLRLPSAARRKAKCGNFKHHAPFFNCGAADFRRSSALAAKQTRPRSFGSEASSKKAETNFLPKRSPHFLRELHRS